jgi:putative ABC transport system permease protein
MTTVISLALAHARHHLTRTMLLIACVFVCALVPLASRVLSHALEQSLLSRARATPLVAGSKGSRVDLVMAALYFRRSPVDPITTATWLELVHQTQATVIPINAAFTARGYPIVATPLDYLEFRSLRCARGTPPALIGEVVLGASVAQATGLGPGDTIFSDQLDAFDLSTPPALRMHITGVLEPRGSADDGAIITDLKTAWVLAGLSHGHADAASKVPEKLVLERSAGRVVVSEELVDYNEITQANLSTFHLHADPASLPLTAIIVAPGSERELSLIKARLNSLDGIQALVPEQAVREVLAIVAKFEQTIRMLSTVMAVLTAITIGLVTALSARIRAREIETLGKLGASRGTVALLFGIEMAAQILTGLALAGLVGLLLWVMPPDLVKVL